MENLLNPAYVWAETISKGVSMGIEKKPAGRRRRLRRLVLFTSFLFFPVTVFYFSPVIPLEAAAVGIVAGSLLVFGVLFALSIFFGRFFCGWLCPAGGLQECLFSCNDRPVHKTLSFMKYGIWAVWFFFFGYLAIQSGGLRGIDFFYHISGGLSLTEPGHYIIYFIVLSVFTCLPVLIGRRAACHMVCWMAPFMILGRKLGRLTGIPSLHLVADNARCISCSQCTRWCPMSIDVLARVRRGDMEHPDCILCGACADICPQKVIRFEFSPPNGVVARPSDR